MLPANDLRYMLPVGRPETALQRYAHSLAQRGELNLDSISPDGLQRLESEGIRRADLERIAGPDRVIRGQEFQQVFGLLSARGTDRAGRSTDVSRAQRVYDSLRSEVDRDRGVQTSGSSTISGAGLRDELLRRGQAGAARPEVTYAANDLPDVRAEGAAPEAPNWFIAVLEFLFQWIPGVTTDTQRLEAYGRELADRHESDIRAFQDAYERQVAAAPADIMGRRVGDAHGAMVSHVADRIQAEAQARGQTMSRAGAESRAETIVGAMERRLEQRAEASATRTGEIAGLGETTSSNARRLATRYFAARETAGELGRTWERRLDRSMSEPPVDHAVLVANPDRLAQAQNAVREENVKSVSYLMALERSGQLSNVPPDAVDGLLAAQQAGRVDAEAVAGTANALQSMSAEDRDRVLTAIRAVPEDRRGLAWATLAREHVALRGSDETQRAGAIERTTRAAAQLPRLDADAARSAFTAGTLGLFEDRVRVQGRDVPVFFHPGVTADRREHHKAMIAEAYGHLPARALDAMLRGEGGHPFNIQVLPEASMHAGQTQQQRPSRESPLGGFFRTDDNMVRLNAHELDSAETSPAGRERAINYILHESSHYLDDLGNTDQRQGFFVDHDVARSTARTEADGDLAPAWAHFSAMRGRHHELTENLDNPLARQYFMLGRRDNRTPAEERRFHQLERHFAALSGSVSSYGAHGGDSSVRSPGINMGEWFAETYASYLDPARRDHLRAVDPVGHQVAARYHELLSSGVPPEDALPQAARFALSTEVSAQQGARILTSAGSDPLGADQLRDLGGITEAFEMHARALDGWQPYRNDAGLRGMRREEARAGVREGRALIAGIEQRMAGLDRSSAEHRRLSEIKTRLERAVAQLDLLSRS